MAIFDGAMQGSAKQRLSARLPYWANETQKAAHEIGQHRNQFSLRVIRVFLHGDPTRLATRSKQFLKFEKNLITL